MHRVRWAAVAALLVTSGLLVAGSGWAQDSRGTTAPASGRYIVIAKSAADYAAMRGDLASAGASVAVSLPAVNADVIVTGDVGVSAAAASAHVQRVIPDRIETLIRPDAATGSQTRQTITGSSPSVRRAVGDPALSLDGLLWNLERVDAPQAWQRTLGSPDVVVGVADTGLDYTHLELKKQVVAVQDFTTTEDPVICDPSDRRLARQLHAPAPDLDFNGHGSWIGGTIAGEMNGTGINGIAPGVKLVALKISGSCGSAYDSTILNAFIWAAEHGIDVVSISFGGYLDRSDPDQDALYDLYVTTVKYAKRLGTVIAASAGNEHSRIGAGGKVISHGALFNPPPNGVDLFGLYEVPGGVPGVVDVGSTGRIVKAPSSSCPDDALDAGTFTWCKPKSDAHQPFGVGETNQLAYYSNYGPRIDVVGPGGARKFNLPVWDRGGTPGWPYTGVDSLFDGSSARDGYNAWEDFGITSNWAQEIPCFTFSGFSPFPDDECYSTIQGTSMAAPHASAVLALLASAHPELRHKPAQLVDALKATARQLTGNETPRMVFDTSPADLTGDPCTLGWCHLGDGAISDADAYGAGLVNAWNAVK